MPYSLPTWSIESLLAYIVGVDAGLGAEEETAPLACPFHELVPRCRGERDRRDDARYAAACCEAVQRVVDAQWDAQLGTISGTAYLAADKRDDQTPYVELFGAVKAADAQKYGAHKASVFGTDLIAKMRKLAHPALVSLVDPFETLNTRLEAAGQARENAERAEKVLGIDQDRLRLDIEKEVARAEVALLGMLVGRPGAKERVAAILSPERGPRRSKTEQTEPET